MNSKNTIPVKVCGISDNENMLEVAALQPQYMGFIFYTTSVRDITDHIKKFSLNSICGNIKKVAVLVNKTENETIDLIDKYNFEYVQLHGDETPEYCNQIRVFASVIKTFSVWDRLPKNLTDYEDCCDFFLFDTKTDKRGGSGIQFDHKILDQYKGNTSFFLSGGIAPEHAKNIKNMNHPMLHAVDINSRFEKSPGVKDVGSIKKFLEELSIRATGN